MIAYITGSGFYDKDGFTEKSVSTRFGTVTLLLGQSAGAPCILLPRHGKGHRNLPHQINHRAHLLALKEAGATAVISLSVCGIIDPAWELARPILATDLLFSENRLGNGETCTIFDQPAAPGRGHLLASTLFNSGLSEILTDTLSEPPLAGVYGHVPGPRFNTRSEIRALQASSVSFISQTCGPEAVLANELELPYALLGFGIDFANGVTPIPTPVEELNHNLQTAKHVFNTLIDTLREPSGGFSFENFVYRFD